jgi:hypothetical protein
MSNRIWWLLYGVTFVLGITVLVIALNTPSLPPSLVLKARWFGDNMGLFCGGFVFGCSAGILTLLRYKRERHD